MTTNLEAVALRERVRDYIYDCTKDECGTGWTLSAEQADRLISIAAMHSSRPVEDGPTYELNAAERTAMSRALRASTKTVGVMIHPDELSALKQEKTIMEEALRRAIQAGNNLLAELEAHQENTGEPLIEEDQAVVEGAKADLEFARQALTPEKATTKAGDEM